MSYARFGWEGSDVYVIGTADGPEPAKHHIECCGCLLTADFRKPQTEAEKAAVAAFGEGDLEWRWDYGPLQSFDTTAGILAHLEWHRAAGHTVPESCIEALKQDDWLEEI